MNELSKMEYRLKILITTTIILIITTIITTTRARCHITDQVPPGNHSKLVLLPETCAQLS